MALCLLSLGCAHLGQPLARTELPADAPEVGEILANLAANDAALRTFRATGTFTLVSPERPGIDRFRHSKILFRRPADLHVLGRGPLLATVFRLTCVGREFLIEFPTDKQWYYNLEGEQFGGVDFSVSPSDVAREMFLPEAWEQLKPRQVRMTAYKPDEETVTLEVLERGFPRRWVRRRLTLTGLPWVVVRSERLDRRGGVIAVVTKDAYQVKDGILFPAKVDAKFPCEQTRMTFDMRNIRLNAELDDPTFNIESIKARLERLGHERVERDLPQGS